MISRTRLSPVLFYYGFKGRSLYAGRGEPGDEAIADDDSSQGVEIGVLVAVCVIALAASIGIVVVIIWSVKSRMYMFISIYVHCMYTLYPTRQQTHLHYFLGYDYLGTSANRSPSIETSETFNSNGCLAVHIYYIISYMFSFIHTTPQNVLVFPGVYTTSFVTVPCLQRMRGLHI